MESCLNLDVIVSEGRSFGDKKIDGNWAVSVMFQQTTFSSLPIFRADGKHSITKMPQQRVLWQTELIKRCSVMCGKATSSSTGLSVLGLKYDG